MKQIRLFRKGQRTDFFATVDDADHALLMAYRWSVFNPIGSRTAYARGYVDGRTIYMHQFVMGGPSTTDLEIAHVDGDGLHNCRSNLRWALHRDVIQAAHDRLPFEPPAAHVHAVTAKGRRYFYDRKTRKRLTEQQVAERLARTQIEQSG